MNRIIKFRAWDDKNKKWLLGYEYPNLGGFSLFGECVLMGELAHIIDSFIFERNGLKFDDLKIMQFSGMTDRNGKEIYEGDIISYDLPAQNDMQEDNIPYIEEVKFIDGCFEVENVPLYAPAKDWGCEVIGNIYENPELLNE